MKKQEISQRKKVGSLQLSSVKFVTESEIDSNRKLMAPELDLTQIRGRYFKQRVLVAAIASTCTLMMSRLACAETEPDNLGQRMLVAKADNTAPQRVAQTANFNNSFLVGQASSVDLGMFSRGNPVIAGLYRADLYVNGQWKGRRDMEFRNTKDDKEAVTCMTLAMLDELGIDTSALTDSAADMQACKTIDQWLPDAYARFDVATQRLDVSIPQAAMRRSARGYVSPSLWDHGVNAGFIGYAFNWYGGRNANAINSRRRSDSAYLGINSGLNLGDWQFRHNSSYSWHSNEGSLWQNISTYAQRAFPNTSSMLTVGDAYTSGELFDSIGFRGINLATDDRMLPDSLRGYAPIVRGIAQSNARVEIRQNGQLIYSTTVAPGAFVIDDLYPTGYGGDLQVTVYETDGRQQQFSVPYGSVPQMLRAGSQRYSLTAGKIRNNNLSHTPYLLEGTYQRGISNALTAYAGSTISQRYIAAIAGAGVSTPVGAFSLDGTVARTKLRNDTFSGTSLRLSYSKLLSPTNTNITLAAYRYSTSGFYGLQEAIMAMDYERRGLSTASIYRQRSQLQLTVSQQLGQYGSLYLTGSARQYWNQRGNTIQYQGGYNVSYKGVSYGLSALRSQIPSMPSDTQMLFTVSVPLGKANPVIVTSQIGSRDGRYDNSRVSLVGASGKDSALTYGIAASDARNSATMIDGNVQYRSRYAALSGSYSHNRNYNQMSLGASGSIVLHSGVATLAPQRGDTMVIIEAPAAKGARVSNISGVRIDSRGYAVVPYVSPYRMNTITLDPEGTDPDVELETSSQLIAPYAGAISKVTFGTRKGRALIVNARTPTGKALPFGAQVIDAEGQSVGLVAQGSLIYIRAKDPQGRLTIKWGDQAAQQCRLEYQLPANEASTRPSSFTTLEAICR